MELLITFFSIMTGTSLAVKIVTLFNSITQRAYEALLIAPRKIEGSLPDTDFMKLKLNSKLIDKGKDIGFSYKSKASDLGAFEQGIELKYLGTL